MLSTSNWPIGHIIQYVIFSVSHFRIKFSTENINKAYIYVPNIHGNKNALCA